MKQAYVAVVLGALLSGVESKLVRWANDKRDAEWKPAQATIAIEQLLHGGMSPKPTPVAKLPDRQVVDRSLEKRNTTDNTCAYISGIGASSLYCDSDSACVYNSTLSAIGCCADTLLALTTYTGSTPLCPVPTRCFDSSDSASYTTSNGWTLYCDDPTYPVCIKHLYKDPKWTGYTLWGCARSQRTDFVYYTPTTLDDTTSTTSRSRTSSSTDDDTSTTTTSSGSATGASATNDPTTTASPSPVPVPAKKSNTGAIVGGVVGGVGAIALIGLAAFFLLRKKKSSAGTTPAGAAPSDPTSPTGQAPPPGPGQAGYYDPNQPQMAQQQGQYGYGAAPPAGFAPVVDPRASIAKPPYAVQQTTEYNPNSPPNGFSPPGSPAPAYGPPGSTPPPAGVYGQQQQQAVSPDSTGYGQPGQQPYQATQYNQYNNQGHPPPQQAQPYGQQPPAAHPTQFAAELPTQRGDGEVRELA